MNVPMPRAAFSLAALGKLGVKRVSVGSALARAAMNAFLRAAHELRNQGTFHFVDGAATLCEIGAMLDE